MNAIFFTQGRNLDIFYKLMLAMRKSMSLEKIGFYTADSSFFKKFRQRFPEIESDSFMLLKEWEIIRDSKDVIPDVALLSQYEKNIGRPFLWNALVADRRIYLGKRYGYDQDYRPQFSHRQMLSILQVALKRMEDFFNKLQPDFIVSFQCVTIGEHLSYLFAQARNIPVLNLRPTRVQNYFYAGEDIFEPSQRLKETYERFLKDGIEPSLKEGAMQYLQQVRNTHAMYEGVIPASHNPPTTGNSKKNLLGLLNAIIEVLVGEYKYRFGEYRYDNHISGYIGPLIAKKLVRPLRARAMEKDFRNLYIRSEDLPRLNYAFFPLHTEPEVTLSVYSKPYLNQIEVARLFSHNLPVGMKLIIKEHPWSIGKRPLSYYRNLLEIPNVMLAHPSLKSRELITHSRLITVISGSIGLEGLILNKPVVVLGGAPFSLLSSSMIRYVSNPNLLGEEIRNLLDNYKYDERALISYVAAIMNDSVRVDFYSRLLGRKGVYRGDSDQAPFDDDYNEREIQIEGLAKYLIARYKKFNSTS